MSISFTQACLFLFLLLCSGCNSAPSQDIVGSFFPSWMLCALIGIILTAVMHRIFVKTGVEENLSAKPFLYLLLILVFTFIIWLIWFGN
jgi:hypothetical protein